MDAAQRMIRTTGNRAFLRGIVGEILTLRQLLRTYGKRLHADSARLEYLGSSKKGYDILLAVNGKEIHINSKATSTRTSEGPRWVRAHGRTYAQVEVDKITHIQRIKARTDIEETLRYVFVDMVEFPKTGEAKFYVLSDREATSTLSNVYRHSRGNKRRPRTPDSDDFWINRKDLEKFADDRLLRLGGFLR